MFSQSARLSIAEKLIMSERERSLDLGHWSSDYQNMIPSPYSGASLVNEGFNLLSWRNYYLRYESDRIIMATETAELILKQGDLHVDTRHSVNTILPVRVIWNLHWPLLTSLSPKLRTRFSKTFKHFAIIRGR